MNTIKLMTLGLLASSLAAPGLLGQGLLGERYLGLDGGWERLENGVSDDGWGAGAELNIPGPADPGAAFGMDLNIRGDYVDIFDSDIIDARGVIRAYAMPGQQGFKPFVGAGFGWVDYDFADTTYVPVEAGFELSAGRASLVPFFRYNFALDSGVEDYWSAGATGVFWVDEIWGLTASVDYRDYDDLENLGGAVDTGWGARVGLIFAY